MTLQKAEFLAKFSEEGEGKNRAKELFSSGVTLSFSFAEDPSRMLDENSLNLDLELVDHFMAFMNNHVELEEFLDLIKSLHTHVTEFMQKHKSNSLSKLIPFFIKSALICLRYQKI
jgi:hypothetical protein